MTVQIIENLRSLWGIRHYKMSARPWVIFNRLVHLTGYHFCACNRFIKSKECYGVVNNDCLLCEECCDISS